MQAIESLDRRMETLQREIEAAEDYMHLVELAPKPHGFSRLARDISVYLTSRHIERRVFLMSRDLASAQAVRRHLEDHERDIRNRDIREAGGDRVA